MLKVFKIITSIAVIVFVVMLVKSVCYKFELTEDDLYNKSKHRIFKLYEYGYDISYESKELEIYYQYLCKYPKGKHMNEVYDAVIRLTINELDRDIESSKSRFPNSDDSIYYRLAERYKSHYVRKSRHSQPTLSKVEKYFEKDSVISFDFHGLRFVKDFPNTLLSVELSEKIYGRLVAFRRIYAWNSFLKDLSEYNPYYKDAVRWRDSLISEKQEAKQADWKTETEAWRIAADASSGELYESFINHYPQSDSVTIAIQRLDYFRKKKAEGEETWSIENIFRKMKQDRLEELGKKIKEDEDGLLSE